MCLLADDTALAEVGLAAPLLGDLAQVTVDTIPSPVQLLPWITDHSAKWKGD